jgi:hypothetical protein
MIPVLARWFAREKGVLAKSYAVSSHRINLARLERFSGVRAALLAVPAPSAGCG